MQLTLTTPLEEGASMQLEAEVLINAALATLGSVTSVDALFRFNDTAGRFQLILGDPNSPAISFNFPTNLTESNAIALAALVLQGVVGDATNAQIDSGGAGVFIISYS